MVFILFLWFAITILACLHILSLAREPLAMVCWILVVVFLPILGGLIYFLSIFGHRFPKIRRSKNNRKLEKPNPIKNSPSVDPFMSFFSRLARYETSHGNKLDLLPNAQQTLEAICSAIQNAKHYILVEYYIIASDKVAVRVTNELISARQRGVHVYLIYDAHGSRLFRSEGDFFAKLKLRGLAVAGFLPFSSFFQNYNLNHRNHRKLLLIDGSIAFSGGTNLGSEYIGRWHKRQQHDYTFKIQGPICSQLQRCFSLDWKFTTGHSPDLTQITKSLSDEPPIGDAEIQILPSGPDTKMPVFYTTALQLIATAEHSVRCITPYFIPDAGFSHALMSAAKRGVTVEMILPSKIDWMSVLWASRSYWDELITNGVHIHQYPPVLLHAKMIIIDEKWLLFGSSNLDIRSFHLNFELDFLVKEPQAVAHALAEFKAELDRCQPVEPHSFIQRAKTRRLAENFCRIFSPLL